MCHDLQQYSNMIMSQLTMQTVVFYSKTPGTWLWDDYKSAQTVVAVEGQVLAHHHRQGSYSLARGLKKNTQKKTW